MEKIKIESKNKNKRENTKFVYQTKREVIKCLEEVFERLLSFDMLLGAVSFEKKRQEPY